MRHNYVLVIGLLVTCMISQKILSQTTTYQIGAVEGSAAVSSTGAAMYQIPVKVSEGTNGMQPSISINYNSQAGNGLLGYGWELSGTSSITRTGKNFYFDYRSDNVSFANDNLMLDGVRLILQPGFSVYKKEVEDFSRIKPKYFAGNYGYEVQTKDGRVLEYGATTESNIMASGYQTTLCWMLSKVTDRFGNYMTYNYYQNRSTGEFYLTSINYTGNVTAGTPTYSSVRFTYESRPDSITRYISGSLVRQKVRLKAIDCYYDATTIIRSYSFIYDSGAVYSRLKEVHESGESQAQYSPTTIEWNSYTSQSSNTSRSISEYWNNGFTENLYSYPDTTFRSNRYYHQFADFNGDGKTDILFYKRSSGEVSLFLSSGLSFLLKDKREFGSKLINISPCDLNGDGLLDLVTQNYIISSNNYKTQYYLFDGNKFTSIGSPYYVDLPFLLTGDFDGDGKFEVLTQKKDGSSIKAELFELLGNNNSRIASDGITNWGEKYNDCFPNNCYLTDFNGNGKTDLITMDETGCYVFEFKEATESTWATFQQLTYFNSTRLKNTNRAYFADFNNDGMSDAFVHDSIGNTDYLVYSTGRGFIEKSVGNQNVKDYVFISDCNRDGFPDIIHGDSVSANEWKLKIGFFNGKTFIPDEITIGVKPSVLKTGVCDGVKLGYLNFNASDFTGDGRTDFWAL